MEILIIPLLLFVYLAATGSDRDPDKWLRDLDAE